MNWQNIFNKTVSHLTLDCSDAAMKHNMASEGGYNRRYRFLKNIMGMWMIQSVKKESGTTLSYAQICNKASHTSIDSTVDCYDERFLAPESMIDEIVKACEESGQQIPALILSEAVSTRNIRTGLPHNIQEEQCMPVLRKPLQ